MAVCGLWFRGLWTKHKRHTAFPIELRRHLEIEVVERYDLEVAAGADVNQVARLEPILVDNITPAVFQDQQRGTRSTPQALRGPSRLADTRLLL